MLLTLRLVIQKGRVTSIQNFLTFINLKHRKKKSYRIFHYETGIYMEVRTNRSIFFDCSKHHTCSSTHQLDQRLAQILTFHNSNHVCYSLDSCQRTVPFVHIVYPNLTMLKRHQIRRTYWQAEKGKKLSILNWSILKLVFPKKKVSVWDWIETIYFLYPSKMPTIITVFQISQRNIWLTLEKWLLNFVFVVFP